MKVNIPTEQANGLERKLSVELHQRICRTHEKPSRKQRKLLYSPSRQLDKSAEANICVINSNPLVLLV